MTNVGGVREIITDDLYGRIAEEGNPDSIAREWNSVLNSDHDKLSIRNYLIQNFNAEIMLEKYKNVIYEISAS
jgi:glycosyltransferase involved in cell wall biosynthesis